MESSFTSNEIKDFFQCPIHLGVLENPRILPCRHSFCERCLKKHMSTKPSLQTVGKVNCPTCQKVHSVPGQGFESNDTIILLLDMCASKAAVRESTCTKHRGQLLNVFCRSCQKLVCLDCSYEYHKKHDWMPAANMVNIVRLTMIPAALSCLADTVTGREAEAKTAQSAIDMALRGYEKDWRFYESEFTDAEDDLQKELAENTEKLEQEFNQLVQKLSQNRDTEQQAAAERWKVPAFVLENQMNESGIKHLIDKAKELHSVKYVTANTTLRNLFKFYTDVTSMDRKLKRIPALEHPSFPRDTASQPPGTEEFGLEVVKIGALSDALKKGDQERLARQKMENDMTQQVQGLNSDKTDLEKRLNQVKQEKDEMYKQMEEKSQTAAQYHESLQQETEKRAKLEALLEENDEKKEASKVKSRSLQQQVEQLKAKGEDLETKCEELEDQRESLETDLDALRQETSKKSKVCVVQ